MPPAPLPQAFDAYYKWLAIPPAEQPPNFYRLLGVELFESDGDVLANAADQRMAHVRTFQTGQQSALSQKILNEIAAAKVCLLNSEKKARYDAALKQQRTAGSSAPSRASAAGAPPKSASAGTSDTRPARANTLTPPSLPKMPAGAAVRGPLPQGARLPAAGASQKPATAKPAVPNASEAVGSTTGASSRSRASKKSSPWRHLVWAGPLAMGLAAAVVVIVVTINNNRDVPAGPQIGHREPSDDSTSHAAKSNDVNKPGSVEKPNSAADPTLVTKTPDSDKPSTSTDQPNPLTTKPLAETTHPDVEPAMVDKPVPDKSAAYSTAIKTARLALAARNPTAAMQQLGVAASNASSPEQQMEVQRLRQLTDYIRSFWAGVGPAIKNLKAGDELVVRGTPVIVVDNDGQLLSIKNGGKTDVFPIARVPSLLVQAIAEEKLKGTRWSYYTYDANLGAFLAVDPLGDRVRARELWTEASRNGQSLDFLMPELDNRYPLAPGAGNPLANVPNKTPPAAPEVVKKSDIPSEEAQAKSLALIKDVFKDDFVTAAKSRADRLVLAQKLLQQAIDTQNDDSGRYVLLREAATMAAEAGDPSVPEQAIDLMDKQFTIDAVKLKADLLTTHVKEAELTAPEAKAIVESQLALVDQALAEDNFTTATQLVKAAISLARKKYMPLVAPGVARQKEIVELEKQYAEVAAAKTVLKDSPLDAAANLTLGRYYALFKGDWERGLPLLKLSAEEPLKKLAEDELANPSGTDKQTLVGDGWWEWADAASENPAIKKRVYAHAAQWYQKAMPELTGLQKIKVEKRLATIKDDPATGDVAKGSGTPKKLSPSARVTVHLIDGADQDGTKKNWTFAGTVSVESNGIRIGTGGEMRSTLQFRGDVHLFIKPFSYGNLTAEIWGQQINFSANAGSVYAIYRDGNMISHGAAITDGQQWALDTSRQRQRQLTAAEAASVTPLVIRQDRASGLVTIQGIDVLTINRNIVAPKPDPK